MHISKRHDQESNVQIDTDEFGDIEGVGTQTSCKIMAAVELGKRRQAATAELRPDMGTATRIYNYMLPKMQDLNNELGRKFYYRPEEVELVIKQSGKYHNI